MLDITAGNFLRTSLSGAAAITFLNPLNDICYRYSLTSLIRVFHLQVAKTGPIWFSEPFSLFPNEIRKEIGNRKVV
jgi:hypothetical protein